MATDYFLKINGVDGESLKKGHEKEIEIESYSWGQNNSGGHAGGGPGGGVGKSHASDFSFKMVINKASPLLFQHCATGKHISDAVLTLREAGGKQQDYHKIKFTDILVSSFQTGGGGADKGDVKPKEIMTFNFAKIEYGYAPQKKDGSPDTFITKWYDYQTTEGGG
jgi:type VI secretion system secreted protein Hcp